VKISLDNSLICTILILVDNCVLECGSLFTLSAAEGLPLFFFSGPFLSLSRFALETHLSQNQFFTKCESSNPFVLIFIQNARG